MFIDPQEEISEFTTKLTGITNEDVKGALTIEQAIPVIKNFIKDSVIVAHNAVFDFGFLNAKSSELGYGIFNNPVIDTLPLARALYSDIKSYALGGVARKLVVEYDEEAAHRADYDAQVLADIFNIMLSKLVNDLKITRHDELNSLTNDKVCKLSRPKHMTFLVKDEIGLKNMFKLVTISHTEYIHGVIRQDSGYLIILDIRRVFNPKDLQKLVGNDA
jgi:DNA polymerase-3 subunit alpha (Gram-positive type)